MRLCLGGRRLCFYRDRHIGARAAITLKGPVPGKNRLSADSDVSGISGGHSDDIFEIAKGFMISNVLQVPTPPFVVVAHASEFNLGLADDFFRLDGFC